MALSDAELMLLVKEGDEDAFVEIMDRYQKRLFNFFYHCGWDFHLSEDLTQEVFFKVYRYRKRYQEKAKFKTFIFKIARNLWLDHVRKKRVRPEPLSLDKDIAGKDGSSELRDIIEDKKSISPSKDMELQELSRAIKEAVETLGEQEKLILMLVSREHLKYREIAEILGIPEGTVKSKVYYTYRKLRDRLEGLNPDEL